MIDNTVLGPALAVSLALELAPIFALTWIDAATPQTLRVYVMLRDINCFLNKIAWRVSWS